MLLALKSKDLQISDWETVLPDALHAIRSLLCTSINATPHEKFFIHPRRTCTGSSMPSWLLSPGPVWLKKHVRTKSDPLVEEVVLLDANPKYAHVQFPDGRESTVSLKDLAPQGLDSNNKLQDILVPPDTEQPLSKEEIHLVNSEEHSTQGIDNIEKDVQPNTEDSGSDLRRSSRTTKGIPPDRLGYRGED